MTRIRIAVLVDSLGLGGTEVNVARTVTRLDPSRFAVVVATGRGGPLEGELSAAGVPVRHLPLPSLRSAAMPRAVGRLRALLREEAATVVHAHDAYSNVFAALACRRRPAPRLVTSRRWGPRHYGLALRWANRWAHRQADRVLANSDGVARSLGADDGIGPERIVVIPNFADEACFAPGDRATARARLGIPPDALVVGVVANLSPVKGHAGLLEAVARLAPRPRLVLVGEGPERAALEGQVRALGLEADVVFAGRLAPVAPLWAAFDVVALASLSEGFPNAIVEAMAAGRPVVATDVGGVRDAVEAGVTGLLVPPRDPAALAGALAALLADPQRRAVMGRAGRARAEATFRADRVMPRLEALYATLAAGGPR